ncbi:hypothetical protein DY000_02042038 [Brassica cretica]|uniref:Protein DETOXIFICATION n=1 Tax=Brassica cretica TaxID=69181 RepID=A0ABQ7BNT4_BRACR|nr:hypothetical protein DY000_02042038 [Brassica cretica]
MLSPRVKKFQPQFQISARFLPSRLSSMESNLSFLGIWTGMICGTLIQTVILAWVTFRTDWTKEVEESAKRLDIWSNKKPEVVPE